MTYKDQEEAVPAFSDELSDEALDRREGLFLTALVFLTIFVCNASPSISWRAL